MITSPRMLSAILAGAVLMAACTGGQPTTAPSEATEPAADTADGEAAAPSPTPASPEVDATPAGDDQATRDQATQDQLAWFLGVLAQPDLDEVTYDERFAEAFRSQVPFAQFDGITRDISAAGPFTLDDIDDTGPGLIATASAADGTEIVITISTDASGQIDGLFVAPGEPPTLANPPATIDEAQQQLDELGILTMIAASVDDGACTPLIGIGADQPAPIGSAFKLYVLAAVAEAVAAGDLAWDTELALEAADISLPSGTLQNQPVGTTVTVEDAAGGMIAISDNTATDLLMRTVGVEAVEQVQGLYGHDDPDLNIPFMTTRQLFALKVADEELQDIFLDGDVVRRRAVLRGLRATDVPGIDLSTFTGDPVRPDELEWFASPRDLCEAMSLLLDRAEDPGLEPLAQILTTNPGIPAEEGLWDRIAFKGGSEPGLVAAVWVMEDAAGQRFALAGSVVNATMAFDQNQAVLLLGAARDLLPSES